MCMAEVSYRCGYCRRNAGKALTQRLDVLARTQPSRLPRNGDQIVAPMTASLTSQHVYLEIFQSAQGFLKRFGTHLRRAFVCLHQCPMYLQVWFHQRRQSLTVRLGCLKPRWSNLFRVAGKCAYVIDHMPSLVISKQRFEAGHRSATFGYLPIQCAARLLLNLRGRQITGGHFQFRRLRPAASPIFTMTGTTLAQIDRLASPNRLCISGNRVLLSRCAPRSYPRLPRLLIRRRNRRHAQHCQAQSQPASRQERTEPMFPPRTYLGHSSHAAGSSFAIFTSIVMTKI